MTETKPQDPQMNIPNMSWHARGFLPAGWKYEDDRACGEHHISGYSSYTLSFRGEAIVKFKTVSHIPNAEYYGPPEYRQRVIDMIEKANADYATAEKAEHDRLKALASDMKMKVESSLRLKASQVLKGAWDDSAPDGRWEPEPFWSKDGGWREFDVSTVFKLGQEPDT